jgi:hypothetical protein
VFGAGGLSHDYDRYAEQLIEDIMVNVEKDVIKEDPVISFENPNHLMCLNLGR